MRIIFHEMEMVNMDKSSSSNYESLENDYKKI